MITKDSPETIPTYTDILHVYSTVEGMSSQLTEADLLLLLLAHHS